MPDPDRFNLSLTQTRIGVIGLGYNRDFFAGDKPERINPSDKARPLTKIMKVTSGSTPKTADVVDALYASVIKAGTFRVASIRGAEAMTHRDLIEQGPEGLRRLLKAEGVLFDMKAVFPAELSELRL